MSWVRNVSIASLIVVLISSNQVDAEVINLNEGSTSGYVLTNGNTYIVQESVSFSNSAVGGSGMTVEEGGTVVLYVPTNVALTATGANGSGRIGGGAGICVPSNATLVITGEGKIVATGGNAGKAGNGQNGSDGNGGYDYAWSGSGGIGGAGGGGSGAAIGGKGGAGGVAGVSAYGVNDEEYGRDGGNGGDGESSGSMGRVYVIGRTLVQTQSGESDAKGIAGSEGSKQVYYKYGWQRHVGGGGGGGGGGAGSKPRYQIGAGGQSGGGGGGGGSGGCMSCWDGYGVPSDKFNGGGGHGGLSMLAAGGSGGSKWYNGGEGGAGGAAGTEGGAGELYVSSSAVVDVNRTKLSAETHTAAQYAITFDKNGGNLSSETTVAMATLGCALPDCIPTPVWQGYVLCGWKDDDGTQYYDGEGAKMLSSYSVPSGIVLHAEWVDDPDALVITPSSGTMFEDSLTVSMSCTVDGATIYYTLDGSAPTADSLVYQKKFRLYGKTTVKAIAMTDGWTNKEVVVSSYALGQCPDPVIRSSRGEVFTYGQSQISINWDCEDGVLRYTTDGSDVTSSSPVYSTAFTISETTTVKAKAFGGTYFDSEQVELTVTRELATVDTPVIVASTTFTGSKNKVVISCTTDQAVIYYTTDGREPTTQSTRYEKPFCVTESCTVMAIAVREEFLDSDVASVNMSRTWSIGRTMGKSDHVFVTSGDEGFVRVDDATAVLGESMRSGTVKNSQTSILSTVVVGPGELSFKWKTSCEEDYPLHEWDHAEFVVDGETVDMLDGATEWKPIVHQISTDGDHQIEWRYVKDASESEGDDCMWVSEYSWQSDYTETQTTEDPVPYSWLTDKCCDVVDEYDSYENVAKQLSLNGRLTVEQCYVAGVDPESATNDFRAIIKMVDGVPKITWDPDMKGLREYQIWGKATLDDSSAWQYPTNALHRFFKVMVEMP